MKVNYKLENELIKEPTLETKHFNGSKEYRSLEKMLEEQNRRNLLQELDNKIERIHKTNKRNDTRTTIQKRQIEHVQKNKDLFNQQKLLVTDITYNQKITICKNGQITFKCYEKDITRTPLTESEKRKCDYEYKFKKNLNSTNRNVKKTVGRVSSKSETSKKELSASNLTRTRNTLINYACQNESRFKSFITLTFDPKQAKENGIDITNVSQANKMFDKWKTQVNRLLKKNGEESLCYLGVPEYQKNGNVHYHMLTNIPLGSELAPKRKPKKTFNKEKKKWYDLYYYDLKYWTYGFSSALNIEEDTDDNFNMALYVTKYLYKDIDNRLFGHNKILKSNDLEKPKEYYLKTQNSYNDAIQYLIDNGYDENENIRTHRPILSSPYAVKLDIIQFKTNNIIRYANLVKYCEKNSKYIQ